MKRLKPIGRRFFIGLVLVVIIFGCMKSAKAGSGMAAELAHDAFTVIVLPDTQFYSKRYPQTYYRQTRWIVEHRDDLNIKFVIHLGDITHNNTRKQWRVADRAHKILDKAGIPYSMVPGNHDMPKVADGRVRDTTRYNLYFGPQRFEGKKWYGDHMGSANDNNFSFFEYGALKFMVVGLEFAPTRKALDWADDLIGRHKDRRVIIVTHCYQAKSLVGEPGPGDHKNNCATRYNLEGNGGDVVWEQLVKRHPNIFMVLSGHVSDVEHRIRKGVAGNTIHEILTDYQSERPGGEEDMKKSGNGWLRILKFVPAQNRIYVYPFSVDGEKRYYMTSRYSADPRQSDHTYFFNYSMGSPMK